MVTLHVTTNYGKALDQALESAARHGYPVAVLWHDDRAASGGNVAFGAVLSLSADDVAAFDLGTLRPAQRHFVPHDHDTGAAYLRHGVARDIITEAGRLENALGDAAYDLLAPDAVRTFFVNLLHIAINQAFSTLEHNPADTRRDPRIPAAHRLRKNHT